MDRRRAGQQGLRWVDQLGAKATAGCYDAGEAAAAAAALEGKVGLGARAPVEAADAAARSAKQRLCGWRLG